MIGDDLPPMEATVTLRDHREWVVPDWVSHEVTADGTLMVHTRWGREELTPVTIAGGVWAHVWVSPMGGDGAERAT